MTESDTGSSAGRTQPPTAAQTVQKPETAPAQESTVRLRVTTFMTDAFQHGETVVTSTGTDVPATSADALIKAAEELGVTIEKVEG